MADEEERKAREREVALNLFKRFEPQVPFGPCS